MIPAPDRNPGEGEGPFARLIIRGATLIDGTGAPPIGPVDIVIEGNRIARIAGVGVPNRPIDPEGRPGGATREIEAEGMYVLPGFVDNHLHTGDPRKTPESEYIYKLWMAHGITAGRGVEYGPYEFSMSERERSARNEITRRRACSCTCARGRAGNRGRYARPSRREHGYGGSPSTAPTG